MTCECQRKVSVKDTIHCLHGLMGDYGVGQRSAKEKQRKTKKNKERIEFQSIVKTMLINTKHNRHAADLLLSPLPCLSLSLSGILTVIIDSFHGIWVSEFNPLKAGVKKNEPK